MFSFVKSHKGAGSRAVSGVGGMSGVATSGIDVVGAGIVGLELRFAGEEVSIRFLLFLAVLGTWSTRTAAGGLWRRRAVWATSDVYQRCSGWPLLLAVVL